MHDVFDAIASDVFESKTSEATSSKTSSEAIASKTSLRETSSEAITSKTFEAIAITASLMLLLQMFLIILLQKMFMLTVPCPAGGAGRRAVAPRPPRHPVRRLLPAADGALLSRHPAAPPAGIAYLFIIFFLGTYYYY